MTRRAHRPSPLAPSTLRPLLQLGLYPLSPASGQYVLGSPLFANVSLDVGAAQPLVITAVNQAPENVYVTGVTWNGAPVSGVHMPYAELMAGGQLQFTLSATPTAAGVDRMPPIFA